MPTWEPTFIADYEGTDPLTNFPVYTKFNELLVNLHIEAKEYRQIQRLYSFLQLNLEFSYDPLAFAVTGQYESWLSQIRNWGLVINGWTASPVMPVSQDVPSNNNQTNFPRTDVMTLFERDINLNCTLATRILIGPSNPIIDITQNLTIILPGP